MIDLVEFKDRLKEGFHRFCDGTSMHGFRELYYAKTDFWKIIWILIVGGALGVTVYQITGAIDQYVHQTSSTAIQPATQQELTYPPLKFCVAHWVHWLNYDAALALNFSKEAILFGMSYLTNVYSSEHFNVTDAHESLNASMLENKISTIDSLYKSLGKTNDIFPVEIVTESEFVLSDENLFFCYKANGSEIYSYLQKPPEKEEELEKNYVELNVSPLNKTSMVNAEEYNSYMAEWIYENTKQYYLKEGNGGQLENYADARNNYSNVHPPNILFLDGYSTNNLILDSEIDEYYINIKASAQRIKNKPSYMCKENTKSFASDTSCTTLCMNKANDMCRQGLKRKFNEAILIGNSTEPRKLKRNKIYFFTGHTNTYETQSTTSNGGSGGDSFLDSENETYPSTAATSIGSSLPITTVKPNSTCNVTEAYKKCVASDCSMTGCEIWTYDVTVTTRSLYNLLNDVAYKSSTSVFIHYPESNDVLIMTETDSKSWEDFVGNVGGLLGIWTGASIISFLQLIYLCCFVDVKFCSILTCWKRKQIQLQESNIENSVSHIGMGLKGTTISPNEVHHIVRRKKHLKSSKHSHNVNMLFV